MPSGASTGKRSVFSPVFCFCFFLVCLFLMPVRNLHVFFYFSDCNFVSLCACLYLPICIPTHLFVSCDSVLLFISKGIYEALELRDGGSDYLGKGVLKVFDYYLCSLKSI